MNKLAPLLIASIAVSQLAACNSNVPNAQFLNPASRASLAQQQSQVSAQSAWGIHKELKRSVEANFAAKDANKDGFITPNEFPVNSPEDFNYFRRLDDNRDGQLKQSELSAGFLSHVKDIVQLKATAAFVFDELDVDNNRRLSQSEAAASKVPGVAANYANFLGKSLIFRRPLNYLRKSDFENLMAFALTNPAAAGAGQATIQVEAPITASDLAAQPVTQQDEEMIGQPVQAQRTR